MKIIKDYSLSITLLMLFLLSWLLQGYFQWEEFTKTQIEHKQAVKVADFVPEFFSRTFENWQSEFLQLLTFVVLTTYLIHKGSHESKDSDDKMQNMLKRIDLRLKSLEMLTKKARK
jgi:hypothetical protein